MTSGESSATSAPGHDPSPLLAAWIKAGGEIRHYRQIPPIPLTDYEESKLEQAGARLASSRNFFTKAKGLIGARAFELFAAEEAERSQSREQRGQEFGGIKPLNPSGLIIGLLLHRLAETPKDSLAQPPAPQRKAKPLADLGIAPPTQSLSIVSPARESRIKRKIALFDAVQQSTGSIANTDVVYCSTAFTVASIPHSDPGTLETWSRTNGRKTLTVRAGWDENNQAHHGLPYGVMPRLMYYFIESEVVKKRERKIELGDSMYKFMQELGISDSAPNYRALREQAKRLFSANFLITELRGASGGPQGINTKYIAPIAKESEFWWSPAKGRESGELFSSYIVLDEDFFKEMIEHGFPLDANAVRFLRKSSLELDIYAWLTHRNHALHQYDKKTVEIPSAALREQFGGAEYTRARDFNAKFRRCLATINNVWRGGLKYELTETGLLLSQSPLQICKKSTTYLA